MTLLTLLLSAADASRLQRLPAVKAARSGRSRGQAVRIVWHDTLDRTLASDGLALAEERGVWRLERHRPAPAVPWPPATDHRLIEEAAAQSEFDHVLPDAMTPVAAFEGRRTIFPLSIDGEPIQLAILDGVLRAVAAERPATRMIIEGPDSAVRTLILGIADTVKLTVPRQGMAEEAVQLADGTQRKPRRLGAPVLPRDGLSVHTAFSHIIGHLADVILELAPLVADPETGPEPVHQMRVAVRRARSALTLFPRHGAPAIKSPTEADASDPSPSDTETVSPAPGGKSENGIAHGLKVLGHMLGPARDWDVFMTETAPPVETVLPSQSGLHTLLRTGNRRRRTARAALAAYLTGPEFRRLSLELACASAVAEPDDSDAQPLVEFASGVLRTRWKKLLHAGRSLQDLDSPGLHGLRLKAKRLRYAAEFFAPMFPDKPAARFIRRLSVLQERLGEFNDTASADTLLHELTDKPGYAAGLVLGFTAARGAHSRSKIDDAWVRFRRRDPFWSQ